MIQRVGDAFTVVAQGEGVGVQRIFPLHKGVVTIRYDANEFANDAFIRKGVEHNVCSLPVCGRQGCILA